MTTPRTEAGRYLASNFLGGGDLSGVAVAIEDEMERKIKAALRAEVEGLPVLTVGERTMKRACLDAIERVKA